MSFCSDSPKVLVADDNFLMRQTIVNVLMEMGIAAETANDGNETISLVIKARQACEPFDIVLLDWMMPEISGLDVLSYFRSRSEYYGTTFLMIMAECEHGNIMKALQAGAAGYLSKPMSEEEFKKKFLEIYERIKNKLL